MRIPKWPVHTGRELELLREVLESPHWGGYHEFVGRLENCFAAYQHCAHGVSLANGTVAIETALDAAGIGPGDEVIVPAISFVSTATAVSRLRATPVFVDIEPFTFNMDPERAEAAVTPATRAILAVHFGGLIANMDRLGRLAEEKGLILIEDAAHAHGSEWRGRRAGSLGLCGTFSFQNSKVMTAGEGGMLTTNDPEIAARVRSFANQGRREGGGWFHHYTSGTNYRMTGLQAAVLLAQLERLPDQIRLRNRNAGLLRSELSEVPGIRFQEAPAEANVHSCYLLLARIDTGVFGLGRDDLQLALDARGIPCTPFYPHPLYGNPLYRNGGCRVEPCPVAEACVRDAFWLPQRALMADEETTREIAAAIRAQSR
jgi:dTDP-4-amino-4,6-dideoxygalactose transaminase